MVERIKDLQFPDQVTGGLPTSGFNPSRGGGPSISGLIRGVEAVKLNEKSKRIAEEQRKERELKLFVDTIKIDAQTEIDRFKSETPLNSQAFVEKATSYRDGVLERTPEAVRPLVEAQINNYINLRRAAINKVSVELEQLKIQETFKRKRAKDSGLLSFAAPGVYSRDLDLRNISEIETTRLRDELVETLYQKGEDAFGATVFAFDQKMITEHLENFQDKLQSKALLGWFEEQAHPVKAQLQLKRGGFDITVPVYSRNAKTGEPVEKTKKIMAVDAMSEKARTRFFEEIESRITTIEKLEETDEAAREKTRNTIKDGTALANEIQINNPDPRKPLVTTESLQQQLKFDLIRKSDAMAQVKTITEPPVEVTESSVYNSLDEDIDQGIDTTERINKSYISGDLRFQDAEDLREDNRNNLDKAQTALATKLKGIKTQALKELKTGLTSNSGLFIRDKDQGPRQMRGSQALRSQLREILRETPVESDEGVDAYIQKVDSAVLELVEELKFRRVSNGTVDPPVPSTLPVQDPAEVKMGMITKAHEELLNKRDKPGGITEEEYQGQVRDLLSEAQSLETKGEE